MSLPGGGINYFPEVSCKAAGSSTNFGYGYFKIENGKPYIRAKVCTSSGCSGDTGWVEGYSTQACYGGTACSSVRTTANFLSGVLAVVTTTDLHGFYFTCSSLEDMYIDG